MIQSEKQSSAETRDKLPLHEETGRLYIVNCIRLGIRVGHAVLLWGSHRSPWPKHQYQYQYQELEPLNHLWVRETVSVSSLSASFHAWYPIVPFLLHHWESGSLALYKSKPIIQTLEGYLLTTITICMITSTVFIAVVQNGRRDGGGESSPRTYVNILIF